MVTALVCAVVTLALIYSHRESEKGWQKERAILLTRIQAPETIPPPELPGQDGPGYVPFDDDEEFWKAYEEQGFRVTNGGT